MRTTRFTFTRAQLVGAALGAIVLVVIFQSTFGMLYSAWQLEEYSHGFLIPLISGYLLWQRRAQFASLPFEGSWAGVVLVLLGLLVYFLGTLAAITTIDAYALVMVIAGCVLAVMGWKAFRLALVPIALLLLMNPLPQFLYQSLSASLQLISSQIGVAVIRLIGHQCLSRRQRHRPRRLSAAGCRSLQRPALPVSAHERRRHHGLPHQRQGVAALGDLPVDHPA